MSTLDQLKSTVTPNATEFIRTVLSMAAEAKVQVLAIKIKDENGVSAHLKKKPAPKVKATKDGRGLSVRFK